MKRRILIFIIGLISIINLFGCAKIETDLQFSKRVFEGLCNGNRWVEKSIDWEHLKAMGVDVGNTYSGIIAERDRADYRKMFFYNLSYTFKASGGKTSAFTNWRVESRDANNTVVAVDTPSGKALLLTLSYKGGKRKLSAIQWQQ